MKKILIITQKVDKEDPILGFFHAWINEFAKYYEKVTVICLWKGRYALPNNVKVLSLGKEEGVSRFTYVLRLYKYIWRERKNYEAVFVHMNPIYVVLCGPLWKILGKRISLWYTHKHVDLKLRLAEKMVDNIFSASKTSFRLNSKKLNVMGHGIDTDKFAPSASNKDSRIFKVVTIGRIAKVKNIDVILHAVNNLKKAGVPIIFEIIGGVVTDDEKKYRLSLLEIVNNLDLEKEVVFRGEISHDKIQPYFLSSDVFVNMCDVGSFDKAVLEAMSCVVPVVASNKEFYGVLQPLNLAVKSRDAIDLSDKIRSVFLSKENSLDKYSSLREFVVMGHNLSMLIQKLVKKI